MAHPPSQPSSPLSVQTPTAELITTHVDASPQTTHDPNVKRRDPDKGYGAINSMLMDNPDNG